MSAHSHGSSHDDKGLTKTNISKFDSSHSQKTKTRKREEIQKEKEENDLDTRIDDIKQLQQTYDVEVKRRSRSRSASSQMTFESQRSGQFSDKVKPSSRSSASDRQSTKISARGRQSPDISANGRPSPSTPGRRARNSSNEFKDRATPSRTSSKHRRSGSDNDSVATEDFERIYQSRRTTPAASIVLQSPRMHQPKIRASSKSTSHKSDHGPMRANHQIQIPDSTSKQHTTPAKQSSQGGSANMSAKKHPQSPRKHHKSNSVPGRPASSGLPEYMYLKKEVRESDVGSDSIRTEDYEGMFEAAVIPTYSGA